jgi:hypothetical protein
LLPASTAFRDASIDAMRRSEALGGLLGDFGDDLAQQIEDTPEQFADFRAKAF